MPNKDHENSGLSQAAAELLLQSVIDYAIFMLDPSGRIESWNPGAERIKGYTASEIIGEHFSRFYTEEDRLAGVPEAALKQAIQEGRFHAEGWRVRKDGKRFWAMVVIDPIFKDGELAGFAKVTRDITHHREMQVAALESERRFRLLVQGVTDYAIYMLDPQGKITNWNTGAERIKGYSAAEILGQHFSTFYAPEEREAGLPSHVLEVAGKEGRYEAEGWRVRKDGTKFWANVIVDAIYDDSGQLIGFAKVTRDLTERIETQRQLDQSREQLFQAQKMEAIGQLTGGLAHDFNNLLTGISGSLDLLKSRLAQGRVDELGRYVMSAQGAAKRAAALTHRLLAFARRQTLDPKPTNANDLITGMEDMIRRTIGPTIEMETALAIGLWTTICDANQLENAILNLSINAKDAMPDGGRLTIETANKWVDDQIAKERDMRPGQYIQVSVSDTGTGMPADVVARAFDPFFTTKPTGEGTGLGLSMIYGFVRQSNGQVRIYTEVGKGTTVALYLPRHWLTSNGEENEHLADEPAPQGPGGTILVVDDEPLIRMLICEVLADSGYRTIEAADGASGLKALRSGEKIDLLVTDVGLPGGMNGRQLADAAREIYPRLKILFITGYAENAAVGNGHLAPGMHVMTKPFVMDKLAAKINEMAKDE
ncbi:PAS domain S-box protein [Mesorhizobium sp. B2-5-9]|uniref:hybrid sensor histidine kinase/response regulator n=1 Tax=unclassified Mesorhizobium TaxID=325217 RepID=UPI00112650F2|nr:MULTISPECIES: PAS domain-containing sensor histidine kinase [unclassified Mesorhizobium]TPJ99479.1 PAS domain S-box protein [Mesorhizobium sp. B2-5-9]TPK81059.1 PAS domain S-box protein [Mesorhizobium sp. B2-4-13]